MSEASDLMGEQRRAISVRVELRLTTFHGEDDLDGEGETVVWAETSLDPAVGFEEAAERALRQLRTVMAVETILGMRLRQQVDEMAAKLEAAGA